MAIIKGRGGAIKVNNQAVAEVRDWQVVTTADITPAPAMGQTTKRKVVGLNDWTGTANLWMDDGPDGGQKLLKAGAEVDVEFIRKDGYSFSGPAIVASRTDGGSVEGLFELSASFEGNGDYTDDSTPSSSS